LEHVSRASVRVAVLVLCGRTAAQLRCCHTCCHALPCTTTYESPPSFSPCAPAQAPPLAPPAQSRVSGTSCAASPARIMAQQQSGDGSVWAWAAHKEGRVLPACLLITAARLAQPHSVTLPQHHPLPHRRCPPGEAPPLLPTTAPLGPPGPPGRLLQGELTWKRMTVKSEAPRSQVPSILERLHSQPDTHSTRAVPMFL